MTKLAKIMLIALTFGAFGIYLTSCNKSDISEELTDTIEQVESTTMNFRVENNTLVFNSFEDYIHTTDYVRTLDRDQLDLWEEEVGFTSARKLYDMALDELELATNLEEVETIESKYKKAVKFTEDDVSLLYGSYYMSTLLNEDGIVRIGEGLTKYTEDKMINILDGDIDKLNIALQNFEEDAENGIYVRETVVHSQAKNNCPFSNGISERNGDYRLTADYVIRDRSQITSSSEHGLLYWVWYEIEVDYTHKRRRWWGWKCNRTTVTYNCEYDVYIDFLYDENVDIELSDSFGSVSDQCTLDESRDIVRGTVLSSSYYHRGIRVNMINNSASVDSPKDIDAETTCP